jgi:hypothetical protein
MKASLVKDIKKTIKERTTIENLQSRARGRIVGRNSPNKTEQSLLRNCVKNTTKEKVRAHETL